MLNFPALKIFRYNMKIVFLVIFFLFDTLINDQNQQRLFRLMLSTDQNQAKDL